MLKFLKSLLGSAPDKHIILTLGEVPSWLDEQETAARETFHEEVQEPIGNIRNAAANLQLMVNNLKGAEQDPENHPKIRSIAKNSLPLFIRAMNTSLAKDLPDDPEAFYTSAVECVKGCLNAIRGQGRYLMVAFPEEMKETKTGIDVIGREINVMTKAIGRFKEVTTHADAARTAYAALCDSRKNLERSFGKEERIKARIAEIAERLETIAIETARLSADPSLEAIDAERVRCADLVRQRDEHLRHYASLAMTASHVIRKAEKIATRKHLSKEVHIIKDAMDILSDHDVAAAETVARALDMACPLVQTMIDEGDIVLKNKEERAVFSDTGKFSGEASGLCTRYRELEKQCREAEEGLLSHPVLARLRSLEREKEQLESMHVHEEQGHKELLEWRTKLQASIPLLEEELVKKLEEMAGETVQFQMNEPVRG
ncbi:MAG: hypothetical protein ABSG28_03020 [Methanoregula sp.]|jgi:hypothetical protein|uniref:hypothetical protein n=1 Tax=Methanoregula sp. TaxID=2052170 RepID=UPI003C18E2E0